MKKLFALLALAILPLTAFAHGPSPQKVDKSIVIKAEPAKVWAIVKDFGGIHKWHPGVASTKVEKKGNDTFRLLTLKSGGTVYNKLRSADDADMKMRYEIVEGSLPVADYNAFMTVKPGPNAGETTVNWVGRFYRLYKLNPPIPEGQDDASALNAVTGMYDAGLEGLKKLAESK
jgi:carbon monoxide dehydrogenase subunit G